MGQSNPQVIAQLSRDIGMPESGRLERRNKYKSTKKKIKMGQSNSQVIA